MHPENTLAELVGMVVIAFALGSVIDGIEWLYDRLRARFPSFFDGPSYYRAWQYRRAPKTETVSEYITRVYGPRPDQNGEWNE